MNYASPVMSPRAREPSCHAAWIARKTATLRLRAGVDVHRAQRIHRHALGFRVREIKSRFRYAVQYRRVPRYLRLFAVFPDPDPRKLDNRPWGAIVVLQTAWWICGLRGGRGLLPRMRSFASVLLVLAACSSGQVTAVCGQGLLTCSGVCTSTAQDAANCGACGHACASGESCTAGKCGAPACQADLARCSGVCVDVGTDRQNCGVCGNACGAAESCLAGKCVAPCPASTAACSGACVVLATDRTNCGACGNACKVHEVCSAGTCAVSCQADLTNCGGICVDLASDPTNCGTCSHSCGGGACTAGQCGGGTGCAGGLAPCGGICVDPQTSNANCGSCGHACGSAQSCASGACTCASGTACGSACVDLTSNGANCGACGHVCGSTQVCSGGSCSCAAAGQSVCGSACADLTSDPANCGACGHACVIGETCAASVCSCPAGTSVCAGSTACIDTSTDADNCGNCGSRCAAGQTCSASSCAAETGAFSQLGGNTHHSGFNAAETGKPPLNAAWVATLGAQATTPAVIQGGRAFAISGAFLNAVELSNGARIWSYNFGQVLGGISWPSAGDRSLYVATSNNGGDTWFRQFDRATGTVGFKLAFGSQWERYWSPLVVGAAAYIDGGTYGGLYGYNLTSGAQTFFDNELEQYDSWSPAEFGGNVYTFVAGKLRKHSEIDGKVAATIDVGWTWNGYSMNTAPVFGDKYAYVISPPNLFAVDPSTMKQAWSVNGSYTRFASFAGGIVYALTGGSLSAMDGTTGSAKWTFAGDGQLAYPPVIANGHVYVSSAANVYAINAATHAQEWTAPVGGWLAIGEGYLLVSTTTGMLAAYRLTP